MTANALVLKFQADTGAAQRAIANLATSGAAQVSGLALAAAAAGRKIDGSLLTSVAKVGLAVTGLQQAFIAFGAVSATALAIAIARMAEYRKIADDAARVGVSTDFFQRFTQSAGQAKEKIDLLATALRNAREATKDRLEAPSAVGDRLAEFNRNGGNLEGPLAAFRGAADQEARIRAVVAAIDDLRNAGRQLEALDLAEKLFGRAAADELISRADATKRALSEMVETTSDKKVVSAEQVANAKELEARLTAARKEMADGMKPILADLEVLGQSIYRGWLNTEEAIGAAVKAAGNFYSILRGAVALLGQIEVPNMQGNTDARLTSINNQISSLEKQGLRENDPDLSRLRRLRDQLSSGYNSREFRRALNDNAIPDIPLPNIGGPVQLGPQDPLALAGAPPRRSLLDRNQAGGAPSGSRSAREEADAYEKLIANIEKANAALKAEYETLGLNRFERERAVALAKAEAELKEKGRTLTAEERRDLEDKINAQARFKELIENTKKSMESMQELQKFIGSNVSGFLSDIISGGKNAEQALMNLTKRLADAALQALLLGQGPLAGIFGTQGAGGNVGGIIGAIFGGFRAEGGPVASGVPYVVGERGPELFVPGASGAIIPNGAGLGGGTIHLMIESDGTLPAMIRAEARGVALKVTQAGIRANNQRLPAMLAENNAR